MIYLLLIALIILWIGAERRKGFGFRILTGLLLMGTVTWFISFAQSQSDFYDKGRVISAMQNIIKVIDDDKRKDYTIMLKSYKDGMGRETYDLMRECERLRDKYAPEKKQTEQGAAGNPLPAE